MESISVTVSILIGVLFSSLLLLAVWQVKRMLWSFSGVHLSVRLTAVFAFVVTCSLMVYAYFAQVLTTSGMSALGALP